MIDHRYLGVEASRRLGVIALCSCGWRSTPYLAAGLAGSAWDRHAAESTPGEPPGHP